MATPKLYLSIGTLVAAFALSVPGHAESRVMEVQVSDLDLSRPSAQQRLNERIDHAVRKVCRIDDARNLVARQGVAECEAKARADAEQQMTHRIAAHKADRKQATVSRLRIAAD